MSHVNWHRESENPNHWVGTSSGERVAYVTQTGTPEIDPHPYDWFLPSGAGGAAASLEDAKTAATARVPEPEPEPKAAEPAELKAK